MATYRVHATRDYTVMSNTHLRDKNMSLKAKGLLSVMLSLPETWDYSMNGLCAICKENITAVKSALHELKALGYLTITKVLPDQTESGRIEYIYDIYEKPIQKQEKQGIEKLPIENQSVENQPKENRIQSITKESITKKSITNKLNTDEYKYIVDYLNLRAKTNFKPSSKTTQQHINARLNDGFSIEDFVSVIDKKSNEWLGTEWAQYLRPATLFGTKFESYLNAPVNQRRFEPRQQNSNGNVFLDIAKEEGIF